jgi:hypothetical protein
MEVTPDTPAPAYFDFMTDCEINSENMAMAILFFPDGKHIYSGNVQDVFALPPVLENKPLDVMLPFAVAKKCLSSFPALLKGPVAGPGTGPADPCRCCGKRNAASPFQEIVFKSEPLDNADLIRRFKQ